MVEKIKKLFTKEVRGLHEAAYLLGIFALASQLLGFVRDRLFASTFGAGVELDVYYAAFRIPDLIFATVSSLVAGSVLIPAIIERREKGNGQAGVFVASIFKAFLVLVVGVCVVAWIAMPSFAQYLFPQLIETHHGADLVLLSRIMLLSPILLGISNLFGSVSQAYQRFALYAFAPLLYNAAIIVGALVLYPRFGIEGLAWGVVLGAALHVLIQIPALPRDAHIVEEATPAEESGATSFVQQKPVPFSSIDKQALYTVAKMALPRAFALGASQLAMIACVSLAATLGAGAVSVFTLAFNMQSVPLAIVGVSYSLAAFPVLAALFARGEREAFINQVATAAKHILFWSIPVAALFIVVRAQIVRTVLGAGNFSWDDTRLTAACLALFAVSVAAQCLVALFTRAYYCSGKTRQALFINTCSALLIVVIVLVNAIAPGGANETSFFAWLLRVDGVVGASVIGVAAAYSFGMIVNAVWLWALFEREYRGFSASMWKPVGQSFVASIVLGAVAYYTLQPLSGVLATETTLGIFAQGLFASAAGIIAGGLVLHFMGNAEIKTVAITLHSKVTGRFKKISPTVDQTASEQVVS